MNKGILIDPFTNTLQQVSVGDFRDIQRKIGCSVFTCVSLPDGNTAYVDDEGLINGTDRAVRFVDAVYPQPLAGRVLILGGSPSGDSADCTWSLAQVMFEKVKHFCDIFRY